MAETKWPPPTYRVTWTFGAPLDFVYAWCTDFTPQDARLEKEEYERRILSRSDREVVYEDLTDVGKGWAWARHVVTLHPPDRWHSDTVGSHRALSLDYRLTRLSGDRTRLVLTAKRRPYGVGGQNVPRATWEGPVTQSWRNFAREIERDYRKSKGHGGRARTSGGTTHRERVPRAGRSSA